MNSFKLHVPSIFVGIAVAVAAAVAFQLFQQIHKLSPEEALRYQSASISFHMKSLFAGQATVPNGDLTRQAIVSGAFSSKTPDLSDFDAPANRRDRDAMGRLTLDAETGHVTNEFGGDVRVIGKDGKIQVVYTRIPAGVCSSGLTCE